MISIQYYFTVIILPRSNYVKCLQLFTLRCKSYPEFTDYRQVVYGTVYWEGTYESAKNFDTIIFSAGKIGYQVEVAPADLEKVIRVSYAPIIEG